MEIEFNNVSFIINKGTPLEKTILDDVSFKLEKGKIHTILGASNSGKTAIADLINALIVPNSGSVRVGKFINDGRRIKDINNECIVEAYAEFLDENNIANYIKSDIDYVIDACDSVSTKMLLINECTNKGIKIISSMGTAKKMDATKLKITTLDKTSYDKLAKKLRGMIDKKIQKKTTVISSTEEVKNIEVLGSNSYVPAVAGLLITNYIINDVVNKTN